MLVGWKAACFAVVVCAASFALACGILFELGSLVGLAVGVSAGGTFLLWRHSEALRSGFAPLSLGAFVVILAIANTCVATLVRLHVLCAPVVWERGPAEAASVALVWCKRATAGDTAEKDELLLVSLLVNLFLALLLWRDDVRPAVAALPLAAVVLTGLALGLIGADIEASCAARASWGAGYVVTLVVLGLPRFIAATLLFLLSIFVLSMILPRRALRR